MIAESEISAALIGASAAVGVGLLTWILGQLTSLIEYRRRKNDERDESQERSRAVLHGSFAICNFLAKKLIEWDDDQNVADLARLTVAQPYVARLIDRSPLENEVLSVSLNDLGLQLESLLFVVGTALGEGTSGSSASIEKVDRAAAELGAAVELVQLLLDPDSAMISGEELAELVANPQDIDGETSDRYDSK